jgi:hypothetical protein
VGLAEAESDLTTSVMEVSVTSHRKNKCIIVDKAYGGGKASRISWLALGGKRSTMQPEHVGVSCARADETYMVNSTVTCQACPSPAPPTVITKVRRVALMHGSQ